MKPTNSPAIKEKDFCRQEQPHTQLVDVVPLLVVLKIKRHLRRRVVCFVAHLFYRRWLLANFAGRRIVTSQGPDKSPVMFSLMLRDIRRVRWLQRGRRGSCERREGCRFATPGYRLAMGYAPQLFL